MKKKTSVPETELPLFKQQSSKASPPPEAQASTVQKKITTASQTVKVLPPAAASPYGRCRCGELIAIPGLDGYCCSKCGWVGKFIFLRR